jgi:exfoliative toxin A/B
MPVGIATVIWVLAVIIHFGLMIFFVSRHLLPQQKEWQMIYPSWFVTFVGIGVIPVTSGKFVPALGQPLFWLAFVIYVAVFPFVLHRVRTIPLPEATQPLLTIIAAPASLCLTGYLASFTHPNLAFATGMLIFAQCLYFLTLFQHSTVYAAVVLSEFCRLHLSTRHFRNCFDPLYCYLCQQGVGA